MDILFHQYITYHILRLICFFLPSVSFIVCTIHFYFLRRKIRTQIVHEFSSKILLKSRCKQIIFSPFIATHETSFFIMTFTKCNDFMRRVILFYIIVFISFLKIKWCKHWIFRTENNFIGLNSKICVEYQKLDEYTDKKWSVLVKGIILMHIFIIHTLHTFILINIRKCTRIKKLCKTWKRIFKSFSTL